MVLDTDTAFLFCGKAQSLLTPTLCLIEKYMEIVCRMQYLVIVMERRNRKRVGKVQRVQ
jgi:hypothetical protein